MALPVLKECRVGSGVRGLVGLTDSMYTATLHCTTEKGNTA